MAGLGETLFLSRLESHPGQEAVQPPPALVGDRFAVGDPIGAGAMGQVFAAEDTIRRVPLALKWVPGLSIHAQERLRREVMALRAFAIPGVVRVVAAGTDAGASWIAMDRIEGTPFPGGRGSWSRLRPTAVHLLETVGRVHAAGILHRDLKPANVLVREDGTAVLLDFGLAWGRGVGASGLAEPAGTPLYMAPEQLEGANVDGRADLYAVGAMLFEALTGVVPHPLGDLRDLYAAKRAGAPRADVVDPDVPARVASVVAALLAPDPADRPRSAWEALQGLGESPTLPWVGPRSDVDALVALADNDQDCDLWDPPGSGVEAVFSEVRQALEAEHWEVSTALETPADVTLVRGIDPSVVAEAREAGLLVFAGTPTGGRALTALPVAALEALFVGEGRIYQVPEVAARALHRRTGGRRDAVAAEWGAWLAAGIGVREGSRLRVSLGALLRLQGTQRLLPGVAASGGLGTALGWVVLLDGEATPDRLAQAMGQDVAALVAELEDRGWVWRRPDDTLQPMARPEAVDETEAVPLQQAHRVAADLVPVGHPRRLIHQIAAEAPVLEILEEALSQARTHRAEGRTGRVLGIAELVVPLLLEPGPAVVDFIAQGLAAALSRADEASYDLVLYLLGRAPLEPARREAWSALVECAKAADAGHGASVMERLEALGPFEVEEVEICRQGRRMFAARNMGPDAEASLVEALADWAHSDERKAGWLRWRGGLAYREERYEDAVRDFRACRALGPLAGLASVYATGLVCLELGQLEEAQEAAAEALAWSRRAGAGWFIAEAVWLERSVAYRMGQDTPDPAIVDSLSAVPQPGTQGRLLFNEAACGWRSGHPLAVQWATQAAECFERAALGALPGQLARSLVARLTGEVGSLAEELSQPATDLVTLQCWALIAPHTDLPPGLGALFADQPSSVRMEVLSVQECLEALA